MYRARSAENPTASSTANVPTRLTGTATAGMIVARRLPRNRKTTMATRLRSYCRARAASARAAATRLFPLRRHARFKHGWRVILSNDRVDGIHLFHDEDTARKGIGNSYVSQTMSGRQRVSRSQRVARRPDRSAGGSVGCPSTLSRFRL